MLSLGMSTNIQTCLEIIVNIWSGPGPGPGPGDFGRTRPRPRCFYGPGRSLLRSEKRCSQSVSRIAADIDLKSARAHESRWFMEETRSSSKLKIREHITGQ